MSVSNAQKSPDTLSVSKETKLCIILDSRMPIIMKVPIPPHTLTLRQLKAIASLQDDTYKFYFRSHDAEFGIVKEEIVDENSTLPADGERIVVWVISSKSNQSSLFEQAKDSNARLNDELYLQSSEDLAQDRYIANNHLYRSFDASSSKDFSCITVQLELDSFNFLGLTLVGPSDKTDSSDRGIYVSDISAGSVVEQDGRIEVGDRILEINNLDVRGMKSDDAVALLRDCVDKRGVVSLMFQRNLKLNHYNKGRFTLPREYANSIYHHNSVKQEEARYLNSETPIYHYDTDNRIASVIRAHNCAINRETHSLPRSVTPRSLYTSNNIDNPQIKKDSRYNGSTSVYEPSTPSLIRQFDVALHCGKDDILTIYAALRNDPKSLNLKDRDWLKVVIKNAFLGSALVKWLSANVYGFSHKREVKRYANRMLGLGLIRNPMASKAFSEKCYYTLSE